MTILSRKKRIFYTIIITFSGKFYICNLSFIYNTIKSSNSSRTHFISTDKSKTCQERLQDVKNNFTQIPAMNFRLHPDPFIIVDNSTFLFTTIINNFIT